MAFVMLLPGPAQGEDPVIVGSGHIDQGVVMAHPFVTTILLGRSFTPSGLPYEFDVPLDGLDGATIETLVTDNSGLGYYLGMTFYRGNWHLDADCEAIHDGPATLEGGDLLAQIRYRCVVPPTANVAVVFAHEGHDLDVDLVRIA